jgi:Predicted acetyltransferase
MANVECADPASMNASLELVAPTGALRGSYLSLVEEFIAAGDKLVPFVLAFDNDDFDAFLARLDACARGEGLPPGFVAHSTWWLVRDASEVVAVSNLRHALTAALLREGGNIGYGVRPSARRRGFGTAILAKSLTQAAKLGLGRVLVTCAATNPGSVKVIVRNGGIFESEEYLSDRNEVVQRYWIDVKPSDRDTLEIRA